MDSDAQSLSPFERAAQDALVYGTGVLVIRQHGVIEHIPPEEYLEMADALKWAAQNNRWKELPKK